MSHVSVESARTGSWSGSVVGGFGFVDYPAGIPQKQWVSEGRAVCVLLCFCGSAFLFLGFSGCSVFCIVFFVQFSFLQVELTNKKEQMRLGR